MASRPMWRHQLSLAVFLALAAITLKADVPASGMRFATATSRRHDPNKIHQRRFDQQYDSYNWSGYAVTGASGSVTDVKGSWTVPTVACSSGSKRQSQSQYSSFWIGIDGFSDSTVEQLGTDSDCQNGKPTYYAWFEFYPNPMYLINNLTVHPGDVVSAEVVADGSGVFTVSLTDVTTGQSSGGISAQVPGAQQSSAEWIAEAPSSRKGILPLANFASVAFGQNYTRVDSTCFVTVNGTAGSIGSFGADVQEITMVGEHAPYATKAAPSALTTDGTSFTDTWYSAGP